MRSSVAFTLSAFVAAATALQIQSNNPAFPAGHVGCITASANAAGAAVVTEDCRNAGTDLSQQNWNFAQNAGPQPLVILGDKCLDVIGGNNTDGTKLQVWTCVPGNTNQLWIPLSDSTFQWAGTNKCIDLTNGNVTEGNKLQIWTCDPNNSNQHWSVFSPPPTSVTTQFRASGGPAPPNSVCMTAVSNADGDRISLDVCGSPAASFPPGNDTWVLPVFGSPGPISTFGGTKCLDLGDGNSTNGNLIQIWSCVPGNTNQLWNIGGPLGARTVSLVGQNKCLDVTNGAFVPITTNIQIWDCDPNNTNQHWILQ